MKFGHTLGETLKEEGFPSDWVQSAISYKQLKRCIKRVQGELSGIGLNPQTLSRLWHSVEVDGAPGDPTERRIEIRSPFHYTIIGDAGHFQPKLIFTVDAKSGKPVDASLSPETRAFLNNLSVSQRVSALRFSGLSSVENKDEAKKQRSGCEASKAQLVLSASASSTSKLLPPDTDSGGGLQRYEIRLTSDTEFFQILEQELSALYALQDQENQQMSGEVGELGIEIAKVATPPSSQSKTDLFRWREIFEMYTESKIFFSTNERDGGSRNSTAAQMRLQCFSDRLKQSGVVRRFKLKDSRLALDKFVQLNLTLLRNMKFQEINSIAIMKILKKFDKHTALGAMSTVPLSLSLKPVLAETMAKAVCFKVSEELLPIVPQLNDYLCPVCFSISFKPVRLRCGHVFCIRCLIVMQRASNDHCPLCRGSVVMQADSVNLDPALTNFLQKYFPEEVKAKQKENQRAAGVDKYGNEYEKCILM
ncbi:MAG: hypothetical protein M1812_004776 [Candelaria pacifica]|nr:MAG: hypothetical protein M1812_004776 [Candelaria pacifica]